MQKSPENGRYGTNQYRSYKRIRRNGLGEFKIIPYTRGKAIRYYCLECVSFSSDEVKKCTMLECQLFPYRFGKRPKDKTSRDRAKAIRSHCLECVCGDLEWIRECPSDLCPVHPYRLSGYQTDKTSLIPGERIENLPVDDRQFEETEQKIAV